MSARGASSFGRGCGRGQGRGGFPHDRKGPRTASANVPSIQQVVPGAGVSIVLKEDQPTGREVQGVVGEVLTKGNHPRGIKVRLRDGRVGRVQRMVAGDGGDLTSGGQGVGEGRGRVVEAPTSDSRLVMGMEAISIQPRAVPAPSKYSDFRTDGYEAPTSMGLSLEDYVVVKKAKGKGQGKKEKPAVMDEVPPEVENWSQQTISTCPVCGEFEGDEVAVSHHIEKHFT